MVFSDHRGRADFHPLTFMRTEALGGRKVDPPRQDVDSAGYASPILVRLGRMRLIAGASGRHVFLVDADTGRLVWKQYVPVRWEVIGAMPLAAEGGRVVFAAPDVGVWCVAIRSKSGTVRVEEVWRTDPDNCHGGFVLLGNRVYGAGYRRATGWFCLDVNSGRIVYRTRQLKKGSIITADGLLYALAENGVAALLAPGESAFEIRGSFRLPEGRGADVWAHPVLLDGRLYLRRHDVLWCYDVSGRAVEDTD